MCFFTREATGAIGTRLSLRPPFSRGTINGEGSGAGRREKADFCLSPRARGVNHRCITWNRFGQRPMSPHCRKRLLSQVIISNVSIRVGDTGLRQSWECHRNLLGARMGNDWCHLFEVPAQQAANSTQELQIESGTRIIGFAGAHNFPKFVEAGAAMGHELRKVGTR